VKLKQRCSKNFALRVLACHTLLLVILGLTIGSSFAKDDKKDEKSQPKMTKQEYEFELKKNWSFGWENYKNKQYDRAKKYFWRVAELDTVEMFTKVHRYLGDAYFKLEDVDSAQIVFELGAEKYPDDPHLHRMVGFIQAQREQIPDAIEKYEKVVELEPESKDDWKQLAALYVRDQRIPDAIDAYNKVLELDPDDLEAQHNVSTLAISEGDIEGAIETKKSLAEKDPQNSAVRYDLGKMQFEQQEYEESIKWFNEYLTLSPDDVSAIEYIGNAYLNLEQYNSALSQYKRILDLQPKNKKIMCQISTCYKEMGRFSSARAYANNALAVDRNFGLAWIVLGEAYEASAEKCVDAKDGELEYNDKLVYEIALNYYQKAKNDPAYRAEAARKISYVKPVAPTADDKFMHKDEKEPTGECYSWIK